MYPVAVAGPPFPGTFDHYVASVIHQWQEAGDKAKLDELREGVQSLGLTGQVEAVKGASQLEIRVGRVPNGQHQSAHDLVNISDAGFGVSQALPVLVALLAAHKGSLVYLEEPEIHLHPNAQSKMARVLARAAERGVIVVAETHSTLLLQGIQTLVAQRKLPESLVKLHWFERGKSGFTRVRSADLDRHGRFGKWPLDFYDVILDSEAAYLDAVSEAHE
ncbi:MAG: AAA family ATPase [Acidobacteria bacterium]|nr:AAA family ATPase [Acidobacteriota bacterium]